MQKGPRKWEMRVRTQEEECKDHAQAGTREEADGERNSHTSKSNKEEEQRAEVEVCLAREQERQEEGANDERAAVQQDDIQDQDK
jgi:hypothetical protein